MLDSLPQDKSIYSLVAASLRHLMQALSNKNGSAYAVEFFDYVASPVPFKHFSCSVSVHTLEA